MNMELFGAMALAVNLAAFASLAARGHRICAVVVLVSCAVVAYGLLT